MAAPEHSRSIVISPTQHLLLHSIADYGYSHPALPGVSNIEAAMNYVIAVLYPNAKTAVADLAELNALVGNSINDFRVVLDDGDGKAASYRWEQREADVAAKWYKIYDMDWGVDSVLTQFITKTQDVYVFKHGLDDRDSDGNALAGTNAGQHIFGGSSAGSHLTLHANSGDGVGAQSGYVQLADQARPIADNTIDLGTTTERFKKVWAYAGQFGTLLAAAGSITDSSGAISFDDEDLSTTGDFSAYGYGDQNVVVPVTLGDVSNTSIGSGLGGSSILGALNALTTSQVAEENSGFEAWGGAGSYYTITGGALRLDRPGSGYIKGKRVTWTAPQTTAGLAVNAITYVYIDSNGVIGSTAAGSYATYRDNIVLFEVLYDGTNYVVVKDNHPFSFDLQASRYLHDNIGVVVRDGGAIATRVSTGTGGAAGDREIKIVGADTLEDHGLLTDIPDSAGAGVTWHVYYTDAVGKWTQYASQTQLPMVYNNAGTPTALPAGGAGSWSVMTLYVSKDDLNSATPTYYAVMDNTQYSALVAVTTAINNGTTARATNELAALEFAQLGYAIIQNNGTSGNIDSIIVQKSTVSQKFVGGGNAGSASLVSLITSNFNGWLSATDTTVQVAMQTLDDMAFHLFVDNIDLDGNTITTTDVNGDLLISPNGTGSVSIGGAGLSVALDGTQNIGKSGSRFNEIWFVADLKDGTNTFAHAELFSLRNVGFRDAARTQPVQAGDALFFDAVSGTWLASIPNSEITHSTLTGLTTGDAGHTQFVMLQGRSGGQTVQGGTAASENLTLESTADATKGSVFTKDNLVPFTNASFSGSWLGTDLGDATHNFRDIYSYGQHIGIRVENCTSGTRPGASATKPGRLAFETDTSNLIVDVGGSWLAITREKAQVDTVWNGSDTSKTVDVSALVVDARTAIWQLCDNANDFERMLVKITTPDSGSVVISGDVALDAGTYRLLGIE